MRKIIFSVLGLVALFFSFRIHPLDEYRSLNVVDSFDASSYVEHFWNNQLPDVIKNAYPLEEVVQSLNVNRTQALKKYGHQLGISKVHYLLVAGEGMIVELAEEDIMVKTQTDTIRLATNFIFGNAVREASGVISVDGFVNMMDFNTVSVVINQKIRSEVIPEMKQQAREGGYITFTGAFELREDVPELDIRIIPIQVAFQ